MRRPDFYPVRESVEWLVTVNNIAVENTACGIAKPDSLSGKTLISKICILLWSQNQ